MPDLIFVLAGRENRKHVGIELLRQRVAPRLLLSVARFEIRRYAKLPLTPKVDLLELAAPVPPPLRHFFVLHEAEAAMASLIPVGRFGTLSEMVGLANWIAERSNEVSSVVIVTGKAHMRRVKLCCRSLLPKGISVDYHPVLDEPATVRSHIALGGAEALKFVVYLMVLGTRNRE